MTAGAGLRGVPPVIVGGVGGSGTRVVANILTEAGVFMGTPRNEAEDNLWFQLLLKRPEWQATRASRRRINRGLRLVRDMNLGHLLQGPVGYGFILGALAERQRAGQKHLPRNAFDQRLVSNTGDDITYAEQGASPLIRKLSRFLDARRAFGRRGQWRAWGWKEPASFLYLPYFKEAFGEFKYVHVMRNGLDMAFSQNQSQLLNYGRCFACDPGTNAETLRRASLKYWVAANDWALGLMEQPPYPDSCYTLKLEELVRNPKDVTADMLQSLRLACDPDRLTGLVCSPRSIDRYKRYDLSIFDPGDVSALERFGYPVPTVS